MHRAVVAWLVPQEGCKPKDRWSESLDGWTEMQLPSKATERARKAVSVATALPTTKIRSAMTELAHWRAREREIELALEDYGGNGGLDLPARLRCVILQHMIEVELPAADLPEAIARQEHAEDSGCTTTISDVAAVVLADLRRLMDSAAPPPPRPGHRGPKATAARRKPGLGATGQLDLF